MKGWELVQRDEALTVNEPAPVDTRWIPAPAEVRRRLAILVGELAGSGLLPAPALAMILPALRAKINGLTDADTLGLLFYLEGLVDRLYYGDEGLN